MTTNNEGPRGFGPGALRDSASACRQVVQRFVLAGVLWVQSCGPAGSADRQSRRMGHDGVQVVHYTDGDVRDGDQHMLDGVGCTWEPLQAQAEDGRFESGQALDVWLVVSSFEPATA